MLGVSACGWPRKQPIQSLRSSTEMNRTFGRAAGGSAHPETMQHAATSAASHRLGFGLSKPDCRTPPTGMVQAARGPGTIRGRVPSPVRAAIARARRPARQWSCLAHTGA